MKSSAICATSTSPRRRRKKIIFDPSPQKRPPNEKDQQQVLAAIERPVRGVQLRLFSRARTHAREKALTWLNCYDRYELSGTEAVSLARAEVVGRKMRRNG